MNWRLANSLIVLRNQVNAAYPNRNRLSDGTIGDAAHALVKSEHNPNSEGVVTAMDITHDPANGADMNVFAQSLITDPRTWYVIFNRRIWEDGAWAPYNGSNPHDKHLHISTKQNKASYDDTRVWPLKEDDLAVITIDAVVALSIATTGKQPSTAEERKYIGQPATQENLDGLITYYAQKSRIRDLEKALESAKAGVSPQQTAAEKAVEALKEALQNG